MIPIRDHAPSGVVPFVTYTLIGINIWVFWQELTAANPEQFITQWSLVPAAVDWSNPLSLLPFITSQFLHAGFLHILFNMWYLWIFGDNVEGRFGHLPFVLFYLAGGVAAGLIQYAFSPTALLPMLGASGAVAGVLGAYLYLFPRHRIDTFWPDLFFFGLGRFTVPASTILLLWFVIQLFSGVASVSQVDTAAGGGVAWWAHIGGFVFGFVISLFSPRRIGAA